MKRDDPRFRATSVGEPPLTGRLTRIVGKLTAVNAVVFALGIVTGPIQARALGPVGRGELAAIVVPLTMAPFLLGLGMDGYVAREVARRAPISRVLGSAFAIALSVSLIGAVAAIPLAYWLGHGRAQVAHFLLIGFLLLPISALTLVLQGAVWGSQDWRTWVLLRLASPVISLIVMVVLYAGNMLTVSSAAIIFLVSSQLGLLLLFPLFRRSLPWKFDAVRARTAFTFGSLTWLATVVRTGNLRLDQVLMAGLVPARQLGLYAIAVTVAGFSTIFTGALNTVLYARVSSGDRELTCRAVRVTTLLITITSGVLAVAVPVLIDALFGHEFSGAVIMTWILLGAGVFLAGTGVLGIALTADGDPGGVARAEGATLLLSIPILVAILPSTGGLGAATISLAAYSVTFVLLLRRAVRRIGGSFHDYLIPRASDVSEFRKLFSEARFVGRLSLRTYRRDE